MNKIFCGDSLDILKTLEAESVDMVMTSPPYWALRDYGVPGQFGLEDTFQEYVSNLCDIFDEIMRVLKKNGTCWVNLGDTYNGNKTGYTDTNKNGKVPEDSLIKKRTCKELKEKSLCQIPSRFAIKMTDRGWILRNEIIWHKNNCMPQSMKDRFTVDFEKLFLFTKSKKYYFKQQFEPSKNPKDDIRRMMKCGDYSSTRQGGNSSFNQKNRDINNVANRMKKGRNKRCVWSINTKGFKDAHFAVFPEKLCITPIKAGCPKGGIVLDPFFGSGTTGKVAQDLGRQYIGIELNPDYIKIAEKRLSQTPLL